MTIDQLLERIGDARALALGGFMVGLAFGAFAQQSKFCLRAGVIEFAHRKLGPKVAVWVLAFSAAVAATQVAIALDLLNVSEARQIAAKGSLSGAAIGGLLFGGGMILARGCASRLLVLSATGNLRALVTGLILTIVAQASLRGALSPVREALSELWTVEGGAGRNVLASLGAGPVTGSFLGLLWLTIGLWIARRNALSPKPVMTAIGVGLMVAAGWVFTYAMSKVAFEASRVTSISFTGPSADTLMGLINARSIPLSFDIGLVPGVFLGSLAASLLTREFELQGFEGGPSMLRYIAGATLMGFGSMLAGGCAVGAGVTGCAIFAITGWIALPAMWLGAIATDRLIDSAGRPSTA
ncbi:MAG: YeeE/YedE family protein [Hyphomicrobiales bacterium]|nr:MAG: YeeE/YedE family protein [Hyphomicrobiales bacterium]